MVNAERQARRKNSYENHKAIDGILGELTALRKERGLTQAELAERMGVTQSYISQIENGYTSMFDSLVDYAQAVSGRISLHITPAESVKEQSENSEHGGSIMLAAEYTQKTKTHITSSVGDKNTTSLTFA